MKENYLCFHYQREVLTVEIYFTNENSAERCTCYSNQSLQVTFHDRIRERIDLGMDSESGPISVDRDRG